MKSRIKKSFIVEFTLFSVILAIVVGSLGVLGYKLVTGHAPILEASAPRARSVIVDAGHGGEDGGATGVSGVLEKELNLKVAEKTAALFRLFGYDVIMTRESDISLGEDAPKGKRKMTDLKKRLEVANANPDAVFLSIHMNKFPQEVCRGFQLWYSPNADTSRRLADIIETTVKVNLQKDNTRQSKKAGEAIYLLDRIKNTAVLAECGFISNKEECALLSDNSYQNTLAACLVYSVGDFFKNVG